MKCGETMKKFSQWAQTSIIYIFPILALVLSLYAKETSQAARNALYLCLDVVIPSLFPFFVLSRLTVPYLSGFSCPTFIKRLAERFFGLPYYTLITIILGYLSGYPTGAKLARDMLDEGLIDSRQGSKMIAVANNCSPLFIIGTIGAGLYKSVRIGFFLLLIHWISGLISAFAMGHCFGKTDKPSPTFRLKSLAGKEVPGMSLPQLVPSAIEESAILCINVTGYIVLFAVLSELLAQLGLFAFLGKIPEIFRGAGTPKSGLSEFISSFLRGIMEITSGSQAVTKIAGGSLTIKLSLISMICGFAGFSVHTQVMGIMKGSGAQYRVFLVGKLIHGLTAGLLTFAAMSSVPLSISTSTVEVPLPANLSLVRLITIGIIIFSLGIAPIRPVKSPAKNR